MFQLLNQTILQSMFCPLTLYYARQMLDKEMLDKEILDKEK
jgi:hypothetical protein